MPDGLSSPGLVDNSDTDLRSVFREQLQNPGTARITTGYFRLSGFAPLADAISDLPETDDDAVAPVRILMGRETNRETADEIEEGQSLRERLLDRFDAEISEMEGNETQIEQIDSLREHIAKGRVALRVRDPDGGYFHAKGASFREGIGSEIPAESPPDPDEDDRPATAVIGTSNFTQRGHVNNVELNLVTDDRQVAEMYESWFDSQWTMGTEATKDVLKIIEDNDTYAEWKAGDEEEDETDGQTADLGSRIDPFEMYKLLAYDALSGRVEVRESPLFEFQRVGYESAREKLDKYDGCIISDSVGLGKSYIGSELLRDYRQQNETCLLIVPANLQDQWESLLAEETGPDGEPLFGLEVDGTHIKIMSVSKFQNLTYDEASDLADDFDVVLVDEGHRFRNFGRWKGHPPDNPDEDYVDPRRHANLRLFRDKTMIMLTATPVNNSAADLKNLISLFTSRQELINKAQVDLEKLDEYQELAQKRKDAIAGHEDLDAGESIETITEQLRSLSENEIEALLNEVMVLRTRNEVESQITAEEADEFDFDFTPPRVHPEEYDLPPAYQPVYDRLPDVMNALHLPHITIDNPQSGGALKGLYKLSLLKRLESSTAAFVDSVQTIYQSERTLLARLSQLDEDTLVAELSDPTTITEQVDVDEDTPDDVKTTLEEFGIDAEAAETEAKRLADGGEIVEPPDGDDDTDTSDDVPDGLEGVTVGMVRTYIREDLALLANFLKLFIRDIIDDEQMADHVADEWAVLRQWLTERRADTIPLADKADIGAMQGRIYPGSDLDGAEDTVRDFFEGVFRARSFRDPKIDRLTEVLNQYDDEKALIFTEFQTTAHYLHRTLADEENHSPLTHQNSVVVTGNSDNKRQTVKRLAPEANNYTDAIEDGTATELDYVVATDTLSEGINAQDVNVIINYDLPWNPTRIVQRVGRVDRIGSAEEKDVHNFFPDGDIEAAITLLERLQAKINDIALLVGKENNILDPSEDEVLERVGAETEKTIGEVEKEEIERTLRSVREAENVGEYDTAGKNPLLKDAGSDEEEAFNRLLLRQQLTDSEDGLGLSADDFEFAAEYLNQPPEERDELFTVVDSERVNVDRGVVGLAHAWYDDGTAHRFGREERAIYQTSFGDIDDVGNIVDLRDLAVKPQEDERELAPPEAAGDACDRIEDELDGRLSEIQTAIDTGRVGKDFSKEQDVLLIALEDLQQEPPDNFTFGINDDGEAIRERAAELEEQLGAYGLSNTDEDRILREWFRDEPDKGIADWDPEALLDRIEEFVEKYIDENPEYQASLKRSSSISGRVYCWTVVTSQ